MNRYRRSAVVLTALALLAAACGGDDDGDAGDLDLVTAGTLTVCTDAPYPPMEFEEDGEFTGFDIELMRAIADTMGLDGIEVINSGFEPITSGTAMESGQCDLAAASITITEEREENVDFSDPYFDGDQSLLTKTDSGVSTLADVAGERLAVQTGTTGETYAEENATDAEIVSFDDPGDLFLALESGDAVAVLQDLVINTGRVLEDDTVAVVETYQTDEEYGFAVKEEGAEELLSQVNAALGDLRDDGTYDDIYAEWFEA